jgi:hypothetical protein
LNITERLHHEGYIDIINVEKVIVTDSLQQFKEKVEAFYKEEQSKEEYNDGEYSFKRITIGEEVINNQQVFIAYGIKDVSCQGLYTSCIGSIDATNPETLCKYFLHENLYCKREDFEKLYYIASSENRKEVKAKFLDCFKAGDSILYVEIT